MAKVPVVDPVDNFYPTMRPPKLRDQMVAMPPTMAGPEAAPWGYQPNGVPKGNGFFGVLDHKKTGDKVTEFSVGIEIDGQEMEVPTVVPGLTKKELDAILQAESVKDIPDSVFDKAEQHARKRLREGKPVFAQPDEKPLPLPTE